MTTLLHIDASARSGASGAQPHGSHTRRLTQRFVEQWLALHPGATLIRRDVGAHPPAPVTGDWIHAAFTPEARREAWMHETLAQSDELVDELLAADVIVAGVPMYNFGPPAQFKAYIDNIVRVGRTFGFDRQRAGDPYWPLLAGQGKQLVVLSSRGDHGYGPGERIAHLNHVETSVRTAFAYMGITDVHGAAIEYDEFGDQRLADSIARAEAKVDELSRSVCPRESMLRHGIC
ncbi:acyl carrier protein phosphodiesterase [Bordetella ansorpii]|uniref:FMN dependent NADH:quinone oxidoreductase n=1 Tax=Bordetella ansorpii TaxID=288768 RepID=A0A157NR53_9BORD|nr:NAD(P)H-dependent oxidoreductase [Bordetella ansorpii]SAI23671.1 acyl carrier protein phosphodiesterase [Bordetella ansorpii]